jgi:hypothetical protein
MPALVSFNISRLSCPDAIIVLMFLVNSSNKCYISWKEAEFFTLSTTSSSGTRSLQFLELFAMFIT